jgi:hypothetical protein
MVKNTVNEYFVEKIKPILKEMGFSKSQFTWTKKVEDIETKFNIQFSTSNIGEKGKYTFNLDLIYKFEKIWEGDPEIPYIAFHMRSGFIIEHNDKWYLIDGKNRGAIDESLNDFNKHIIPFLIETEKIDGLIKYFGDNKDIHTSILWALNGNIKKAIERAKIVYENTKPWYEDQRQKVKMVIEKLNSLET